MNQIGQSPTARATHSFLSALVLILLAPAAGAEAPPVDVEDGHSTVVALPWGVPRAEADRENRWFAHSNLQPAGRFVRQGQRLGVTVSGPHAAVISIGLFGVYKDLNGGVAQPSFTNQTVPPDLPTWVTASIDGLVYVKNEGSQPLEVTIEGGEPIPTFVGGVTTKANFDAQMARWPQAPFATFIGEHIFADIQYHWVRDNLPSVTAERIAGWDQAVTLTNEVYGLSATASGLDRKSSNRIHITNPDTGPGAASAGNYRLTFHGTGGAVLLQREADALWGLWHEIGHSYQTPHYRWAGLTEVTVNLSSMALEERLTGENRLDTSGYRAKRVAYFGLDPAQRNFDTQTDVWFKLLMFDQLRRSFGEAFYPRLSARYRQLRNDGVNPSNDEEKRQLFALTVGQVADRNMTPFFEQWGIALDSSTRAGLARLPALGHPIWNNHDRRTDVVENALPPL